MSIELITLLVAWYFCWIVGKFVFLVFNRTLFGGLSIKGRDILHLIPEYITEGCTKVYRVRFILLNYKLFMIRGYDNQMLLGSVKIKQQRCYRSIQHFMRSVVLKICQINLCLREGIRSLVLSLLRGVLERIDIWLNMWTH